MKPKKKKPQTQATVTPPDYIVPSPEVLRLMLEKFEAIRELQSQLNALGQVEKARHNLPPETQLVLDLESKRLTIAQAPVPAPAPATPPAPAEPPKE